MPYGTSIHNGRIRNDPATFSAAKFPIDPVVTRDIVSNNLDHCCDSFGQVRMNISGAALTPRKTGIVADTWYQITASPAFPLPVGAAGDGYQVRVRLGGLSSGGASVKFAAVLAVQAEALGILTLNVTDSVFETATTSSATAVWLTGATPLSGYTTMLALTPEEVARYTVLTATPVDLSGDESSIAQCLVSVVVFGSSADGVSEPTLVNAYAAEWIAPP